MAVELFIGAVASTATCAFASDSALVAVSCELSFVSAAVVTVATALVLLLTPLLLLLVVVVLVLVAMEVTAAAGGGEYASRYPPLHVASATSESPFLLALYTHGLARLRAGAMSRRGSLR